MVFIEVFHRNAEIVYKSYIFSKATLLVFTFGIASVVLPFIFAYKSGGFWIKRDILYEQPDIKFKGEYIFTATTNNLSNPITCSTIPYFQQTFEFLDRCSLLKIREIDKNYDGKTDELDLNLQVNLPEETFLTSLCIIIPLDYKLHGICPWQMQAAIIFQEYLPITVSNYHVIGDVGVTQSSPLHCHKKRINTVYNYSIITNTKNIDDYAVLSLTTNYSARNISTILKNIYRNFIPGNKDNFSFNLKIRYPEHKIYYEPDFGKLLNGRGFSILESI